MKWQLQTENAMSHSYTHFAWKHKDRNNCRIAYKIVKADVSAVMSEFKGRKAKGFE